MSLIFKHESIQPIAKIYNSEFGVLYIQDYNEKGSLKDLIFNNVSFNKKKKKKNFWILSYFFVLRPK
jgi:hypothetical protein